MKLKPSIMIDVRFLPYFHGSRQWPSLMISCCCFPSQTVPNCLSCAWETLSRSAIISTSTSTKLPSYSSSPIPQGRHSAEASTSTASGNFSGTALALATLAAVSASPAKAPRRPRRCTGEPGTARRGAAGARGQGRAMGIRAMAEERYEVFFFLVEMGIIWICWVYGVGQRDFNNWSVHSKNGTCCGCFETGFPQAEDDSRSMLK